MSNISKTLALACAAVLAQYDDVSYVLACPDGNVFLPHATNLAQNHSRMSGISAPVTVTRDEVADLVAAEQKRVRESKGKKPAKAATEKAAAEKVVEKTEDEKTAEAKAAADKEEAAKNAADAKAAADKAQADKSATDAKADKAKAKTADPKKANKKK